MQFDPFAQGALIPGEHDQLVANLNGFAQDAGIHPLHICTPLAGLCTAEEIEYVRKFNAHRYGRQVHGVCYTGKYMNEVEDHMSALAGALVRNFIRARLLTLGMVLDTLASGGSPECTCLLIPNFFVSKAEGGGIATWQVSAMLDLLLSRQTMALQTIVYVSDLKLLDKEYGAAVGRMIKSQYQLVNL